MSTKCKTLVLSIGLFVCGCAQVGFWKIGEAPGAIGLTGAISTVLSALLGMVAFRDACRLEDSLAANQAASEAAESSASAANAKAFVALLGRRLSQSQMEAISASLAAIDLTGTKLAISYIETATDAKLFAESLAEFLKTRGPVFDWPKLIRSSSIPPHIPEINGTKIGLATTAGDPARLLASVLADNVDEISIGGLDSHWNWQQDRFAVRIIVGHKP